MESAATQTHILLTRFYSIKTFKLHKITLKERGLFFMCTAIWQDNYFGRNLDYEHTFGEKVTITPRNFKFSFRNGKKYENHYAITGMALPFNDYPLYFDATNEKGLSMAGLNFPNDAVYNQRMSDKDNVASFELIPYILCGCKSVCEAEDILKNINITDDAFDEKLKPTFLHWLIADENRAITLEQTEKGLCIYENPVGVLTNSPEFSAQMINLKGYLNLTAKEPENRFSDKIALKPYSKGMGGIGLPGDLSSMSRFVRASFVKLNSVFDGTEEEKISQFFHILYSVYQQKGCVRTKDGFEMTNYSSCCNVKKGIYYYATYYGNKIRGIDMHKEDLESDRLIVYDPFEKDEISILN